MNDPSHGVRGVTVEVPGKVMLAGEYTVLGGGPALAATIRRHLRVHVTRAPDVAGCRVRSNLWSAPRLVERGMGADCFETEPLMAAVARAMRLFSVSGAAVSVTSDLTPSHGVGSSSALRLGVLVGLSAWSSGPSRGPAQRDALWSAAREAYRLQREHQRQASGYDVATQLVGGLTLFTPGDESHWPGATKSFARREMVGLASLVHVYVGGAGAPTGTVLRDTLEWLDRSARLPRLHAATSGLLAALGRGLAAPGDAEGVRALARATAAHRDVFAGSPHFPEALAAGLASLPGEGETWSFKTTGAGGEDALLLIGPRAVLKEPQAYLETHGWQPLGVPFEAGGTRVLAGDLDD